MLAVSIHAPARGATCFRPSVEMPITRFRSTPLREGRQARAATLDGVRQFRSTPLREGRRRHCRAPRGRYCFDPRPCARGDRRSAARWSTTPVSIHAPARGATSPTSRRLRTTPSFDPRPCARGDPTSRPAPTRAGVSIHAPARGATRTWTGRGRARQVSIHAPARGATAQAILATNASWNPALFANPQRVWRPIHQLRGTRSRM